MDFATYQETGCVPRTASSDSKNSYENFDFNQFLSIATGGCTLQMPDFQVLNNYIKQLKIENLDLFKHVFVFAYRLSNLNGYVDLLISSIDFLTNILGFEKFLSIAKEVYSYLMETLTKLYNKLLIAPPTTEGRAVEAISYIKRHLNTVYNSSIVTAIRDFTLSVVSFGYFQRGTADQITRVLGPAPKVSGFDLVDNILESTLTFLQFGEQLWSGAPLSEVFAHKDPVANFTTQAHELDTLKDLTFSGLPVDGKICRREYLGRVNSCITGGEAVVSALPIAAPQRKPVDICLKKLKLIKSTFMNMMNAEERPMPYCVCVTGAPGIGKGLLIDYFGMVWSNSKGRDYSPNHVYHRQATEEYWSGYEPASKPIIHYSEPGSLNVNIARTRGDPVMTEFLSVCDNQPFMCNMADVESKGKVYALPELIVMDCNDPRMNLKSIVNNPAAVKRRILYVEPQVKREFAKSDGCRIDQAKSLNSSTPKLDRWTFKVWREVPQSGSIKETDTITVLNGASIYELTNFLDKEYKTHIFEQENRCNILKGVNINDYFTESNHIQDFLNFNPSPSIGDEELTAVESRLKTWRFHKSLNSIVEDWITYIIHSYRVNGALKQIFFVYIFLMASLTSVIPFIWIFGSESIWCHYCNIMLASPILEEIFKEYMPAGSHVLGISEFALSFCAPYRIPALLFHCSHFAQSFRQRFVLHTFFNVGSVMLDIYFPHLRGTLSVSGLAFILYGSTLCVYLRDEWIDKALEIVYAIFELGYSAFRLLGMYIVSFLALIVPANLYKWIAIHMFQSKLARCKDKLCLDYQLLRATLGLENTYSGAVVPRLKVAHLISAISGVLLIWRLANVMRSFSPQAEGNNLSTSKNWTEEEVNARLEEIQEECRCDRMPKRERRGNGIDWQSLERPIPIPITEEQMNDKVKIVSSVDKNVRIAHFHGERVTEGRILGICEDIAIVNRHTLGHDKDGQWEVKVRLDNEAITSMRKCIVDKNEICQVDGDVWVIRLRGLKFKDIRTYVSTSHVIPPVYGTKGQIGGEPVLIKKSQRIVAQDPFWGPVPVENVFVYKWTAHARGLCGTPLFCEYSGGFGVVGIHVAGTPTSEGYSQSIEMSAISKAMQILSNHSCTLGVNSEGRIRLPPGQTINQHLNERSPARYEDVKGIDVFGTLDNYRPTRLGKSKLQESPFLPYAKELTDVSPIGENGHPLYGAPPFSAGFNKETGEYQAPYNHFIKKCGVVKNSLHPKILRKAITVVTDHLCGGLENAGLTELRPVPLSVAINGDPEDFYMRPVRPSTSGGWAWPGKKSKYMRECCLPFKEDAREFTLDVNEQVLEQLLAYERGEDSLPLLGAQLKDEPRTYSKIKDRKTRVFCMSPVESTLVNRMFLSPFYTKMVEHDDLFCAAIGINMHSTDVTDLVNKMTSFSDKFMEGDYGGYDTSMPYDIGLAANTVVYNVLRHFGYSDRELGYVKGILSDNLYPTIVMRGDIFAAPALQPSGKYATAEDNSLRGLLLLVYAFIEECTEYGSFYSKRTRTTKYKPEEFFSVVRPVVYGDDMMAGVKPDLQSHFNNITYQKFCTEVYGLDFTNAQKTMEMNDFLSWNETSFLKRTFNFRDDLGQWVAPIEKASIMKSICYYLPSRNVSTRDQLIDSCVSAARELFFHLDADEYEQRRWKFAEVIGEVYELLPADVIKQFPTFEEIRTQLYGERFTLL